MKKNLFICLILLTQPAISRTNILNKGMIGLAFAPEYSYRYLTGSDSYSWLIDLRNEIEIAKLGFTGGFNFSYRVKKKIFIESGACYSNQGLRTKKSDLLYDDPEPDAPVALQKNYTYSFLEIPIRLNYQVFDSSSFFTSIGVAIEIPTLEKVKTVYYYSDGRTTNHSFHTLNTSTSIGISVVAGLGYFFRLNERLFIKAVPFYKSNLIPSIRGEIKEYFHSYGLDVGLYLSY